MNKEQVNTSVSELKDALVAHIKGNDGSNGSQRDTKFDDAKFTLPSRQTGGPAPIDSYVQAVLKGLGLPNPIGCPKGSDAPESSSSAAAAPSAVDSEVGELVVREPVVTSNSSSSSASASEISEADAAAEAAEPLAKNGVRQFVLENPNLGFSSTGVVVKLKGTPEEKAAQKAEYGFRYPRTTGELTQLRREMRGGAATLSIANVAWVIKEILEKSYKNSDYLVHNGKQVLRVPCSKEMAQRFCAPIYMNYIGIKVDSVCDAMTLDTYKHIPGGLEDSYLTSLDLTSSAAKAVFKKWNDRVKSILDALASAGLPATGAGFPNPLTKPTMQSVTVLSGVNPIVREAVYAANTPGAIRSIAQPQIFTVGYAKPLMSMSGGATRNPHAPLYPKLVMNGGANPFAIYGGNAAVDNMVKVIENRIDSLKTEYKSVSGIELDSNIDNKIKGYVTNVKDGFNGLEENLKNLRDANGYLAQYPLSEGLPRPRDTDALKSLADKGREVSEKSLRLSKQIGKLSEIEELLRKLVENARPRPSY